MLASWEGHAEVVKLLMAAGADVHVQNQVSECENWSHGFHFCTQPPSV
jgi:hypothetical protein